MIESSHTTGDRIKLLKTDLERDRSVETLSVRTLNVETLSVETEV